MSEKFSLVHLQTSKFISIKFFFLEFLVFEVFFSVFVISTESWISGRREIFFIFSWNIILKISLAFSQIQKIHSKWQFLITINYSIYAKSSYSSFHESRRYHSRTLSWSSTESCGELCRTHTKWILWWYYISSCDSGFYDPRRWSYWNWYGWQEYVDASFWRWIPRSRTHS